MIPRIFLQTPERLSASPIKSFDSAGCYSHSVLSCFSFGQEGGLSPQLPRLWLVQVTYGCDLPVPYVDCGLTQITIRAKVFGTR